MRDTYCDVPPKDTLSAYSEAEQLAIASIRSENMTEWVRYGVCNDADPEALHTTNKKEQRQYIEALCGRCVVKSQCLAYALDNDEKQGIWGGMTEEERRAILNRRNNSIRRKYSI